MLPLQSVSPDPGTLNASISAVFVESAHSRMRVFSGSRRILVHCQNPPDLRPNQWAFLADGIAMRKLGAEGSFVIRMGNLKAVVQRLNMSVITSSLDLSP